MSEQKRMMHLIFRTQNVFFTFKMIDLLRRSFVFFFSMTLLDASVLYFAKHTIKSEVCVLFSSCTHALSSVRNFLIVRPQLNTSDVETKKAPRWVYSVGMRSQSEMILHQRKKHTHTHIHDIILSVCTVFPCVISERKQTRKVSNWWLMLSMFPLIVVDVCGFFSFLFFHRSSFIIIEKRYKESATEKKTVLFFFHFFNDLNDEVNELQPHTFFSYLFLFAKKKEKLDIILILIYSFYKHHSN